MIVASPGRKYILSTGTGGIVFGVTFKYLISKRDTNILYTCVHGQGLYRSSDEGATWQPIGGEILGKQITAIGLLYLSEEILFAGVSDRRLYWTTDSGQTWQSSETEFSKPITWITYSMGNAHKIFVTTQNGDVYCSFNEGKDFEMLRKGSVSLESDSRWSLAVSLMNSNVCYLGTSQGAFRSTDGGLTFEPIGGGLLSSNYHVNTLQIVDNRVYAGMREGIFYTVIPDSMFKDMSA